MWVMVSMSSFISRCYCTTCPHGAYGPDEVLYKQMLLYDLSHVAYGPDEFLYKQMLLYNLSHVDVVVPMSSCISRCYCTTCLM